MEYKHAIPGQIYKGIQACNTWSNLLRNTSLQCLVKFMEGYILSLQYLVKFTKESRQYMQCRHAIHVQIYLGIQACNTWSNLQRNTSMQYLLKFAKEYKHAIPGQFSKESKHAIPGQIYKLRNTKE